MDLSLAEARRIALVAQGFGRRPARTAGSAGPARPAGPARRAIGDVRKLSSKIFAIQLDSVNVLVRSHYLPAYSRLGPYPMDALDTLAYSRRELFECWGHAACLMPVDLYPLLWHRMTALRTTVPWSPDGHTTDGAYLDAAYSELAERGPLAASELSNAGTRTGSWWGWGKGKLALEQLLDCGYVAVAGRRGFTRLYDITERVIPAGILSAPAPKPAEAQKELLCLSAKALGVTTARYLGGYFGLHSHRVRVRRADGKPARAIWPALLAELVEEGRLHRVTVEGWKEPGYLLPGTRMVRSVAERALLSPFDSFMRCCAELCCGFTQPLAQQLYVPAERRVYGYYVLPFLLGDTLVGRCDLKADRKRRVLMVQSAFVEPGHDAKHVAAELAAELRRLREWLELDCVEIASRGNLAAALRRCA